MQEVIATAPVSFTENAIKEIKRLMQEDGFDTTQKLRVGVKGGGCSGLSDVLGFDAIQPEDETHFANGLEFIMNLLFATTQK